MNSPQADLSPPPHERTQRRYTLNEDEVRALTECNDESFWYRSFPFSALSMLGTKALIRRGMLTTSPKFGATPKVVFAGVIGYFLGKLSYMGECKKKMMRLENSPLADMMRAGTTPIIQLPQRTRDQTSEFSDARATAPHETAPVAAEPTYREHSNYESSAVEVPFSASMSESSPSGIEDRLLLAPEPIVEESSKQKPVTYDELRDQNRDPYHKAGQPSTRAPVQQWKPRKEGAPVKKNKYGDVLEE